jgi:hypothetical protein
MVTIKNHLDKDFQGTFTTTIECQGETQPSRTTDMTWPKVEILSHHVPMPLGYTLEHLNRADIPKLVQCLQEWYPAMSVGELSCYLHEDFYTSEVSLENEPEKDILVLLVRYGGEPAAALALERKPYSQVLYGSLGVIAPQHRGQKLAHVAPVLLETIGRSMNFGLVYYYVTLRIPQAQAVAEAAGYGLVGILPASDRVLVAAGVIKHMHEAIYAKVLKEDSDLLLVKAEHLTPQTKALFEFLFGVLQTTV